MQDNCAFAPLEYPSMLKRLFVEIRETIVDFRNDPRAFIASLFRPYPLSRRRTTLFRMGLSVGAVFYLLVLGGTLLLWLANRQPLKVSPQTQLTVRTPLFLPQPRLPESNDNSREGGGGGGGRDTIDPASGGHLPAFVMVNPIIAPRPEETLRPPALPVIETVKVDPRAQVDRDDLTPTGLPQSTFLPPSAGPGSNGGVGTGENGGMGPGKGIGVGPGNGENTGDLNPSLGGRQRQTSQAEKVDSRPVLLNQPHPLFTEEARKNKVQGVVKVRILIDPTGAVKEVVIARGLPDGLNEQAIRAAYQMRFRPALKNGQAVAYWLNNVEVEFNLR
jgi:TonB family protein